MLRALLAPLAKLLVVELALHLLFVFDSIVVDPFARLTLHADEMFLAHV